MVLGTGWKTSALTSSLLSVRTKDSLLPVETVMQGSRHEEVRKDNGTVTKTGPKRNYYTRVPLRKRNTLFPLKITHLRISLRSFHISLKEGGGGLNPQSGIGKILPYTFPVSCFTNWSWKFSYWHLAISYFSWSAKKGGKMAKLLPWKYTHSTYTDFMVTIFLLITYIQYLALGFSFNVRWTSSLLLQAKYE